MDAWLGDFSNTGLPKDIEGFRKFIESQREKFKEIIVIAGNHDLTFDLENYDKKLKQEVRKKQKPSFNNFLLCSITKKKVSPQE